MHQHLPASAMALQAFSERAGAPKGTVEADDLTMAIQAHATFAFVQPPPQDVRTAVNHACRVQTLHPHSRPGELLLRGYELAALFKPRFDRSTATICGRD